MQNKVTLVAISVFILVVIVGGIVLSRVSTTSGPTNLEGFAQCLTDKGVKFFGAFWCPHCQAQKKLFGSAVSKLPYIECSTPDGNSQTQICKDNAIQSYPTWVFPDHSTTTGEVPLETIAERSSCTLPAP